MRSYYGLGRTFDPWIREARNEGGCAEIEAAGDRTVSPTEQRMVTRDPGGDGGAGSCRRGMCPLEHGPQSERGDGPGNGVSHGPGLCRARVGLRRPRLRSAPAYER